jgi:prepilin-type processing-associated H-X9-DG protein
VLLIGCAEKPDAAHPANATDSQATSAAPAQEEQVIAFPPTAEDRTVSWGELTKIIIGKPDSVRTVMQTHARKVTVAFLDGHRLHSTEPSIDAIVTLLRKVDPAGHILVATE